MHPYLFSALGSVTDCRSKVRDLVLVKRIDLQPGTALVQRIFNESLKFGCQGFFEDDTLYSVKIISWQKFKNEIQFTHFLGSERQSPVYSGCIEENFHAAHVFLFAGAIGSPAILHDAPLPPPQPSQEEPQDDPLEKQELASARKCTSLPIREHPANRKHQSGDAIDEPVLSNAPETHQALAGEIERLPPFSTSKAWYREKFFSPILNLPTLVRSEQYTSRERERSQVINDIDRLCATLDATTLEEQSTNDVPIDSGFKQKSCGSSNQASSSSNKAGGSGSSRNLIKRDGQRSAGSDKPKLRRKRSKQSRKSGSESESESGIRKRTKVSDPKSNHTFQCRIYEKSNTPPDGRPSTPPVYEYPTCNAEKSIFKSHSKMIEHILRVHIKPIQCRRCMSRFGRPSERNRHEKEVCIRDRLVKRPEGEKGPNDVPKYVIDMGKEISDCPDIDSLDSVLYPNGQKRYDYLDKTYDPEENQGESKNPIPQPPLNINSHERNELESSNVGSCPVDGADIETHYQNVWGNHIDHVHRDLNSQSNGLGDGPSDLDWDDALARDLSNIPNFPIAANPDTATMIEKIVRDQPDAEEDPTLYKELISTLLTNLPPTLYKELISTLFTNLPPKLLDDLVTHIPAGPGYTTCISPDVLFKSAIEELWFPNNYARQLASDSDDPPDPLRPAPDSGFDSIETDKIHSLVDSN